MTCGRLCFLLRLLVQLHADALSVENSQVIFAM